MEGCPIRESPGQAACAYPKLFVACYALHRLQVPRHPPCALSNLITKMIIFYFQILNAPSLSAGPSRILGEIGVLFSLCSFQGAQPSSSSRPARRSQWLMRTAALQHGLGSASRKHSTNECQISAFRAFQHFGVMFDRLCLGRCNACLGQERILPGEPVSCKALDKNYFGSGLVDYGDPMHVRAASVIHRRIR